MTRTQTLVSTATLIAGLAFGCDRTPAEEQERAAEAQREANEKVGEARQEAREEIREAKQEAAEERNDRANVDLRQRTGATDVENDGVIDRNGDGVDDRDTAAREPVRGTDVKDEHAEEIADAKKKLAEDKAEAQEEANETIKDVKEEIAEDRRELKEYVETELRDADKELTEIGNEAAEAEPAVRRRTEASLTKLRAECDAIRAQGATVDDKPAAQLTAFRKRLETRFEKLDDRVEALRKSL